MVPFELRDSRLERGQVGSRAKHPVAGSGQDHDPNIRLLLTPRECRNKVAQHDGRERIALLGPVQGDGRDAPVDGKQSLLQSRDLTHDAPYRRQLVLCDRPTWQGWPGLPGHDFVSSRTKRRVEKLIRNKYRTRSRACGAAARSMREDHKGRPSYWAAYPMRPAARATPTPISTTPPSSSARASTTAPKRWPSSSPINDMTTLTTPIVIAARTI